MNSIQKFQLNADEKIQEILIPFDGDILSVGFDPWDKLCLWVDVETVNTPEKRTIYIFKTGEELEHLKYDKGWRLELHFIGTVVNRNTLAVFHVFESQRREMGRSIQV